MSQAGVVDQSPDTCLESGELAGDSATMAQLPVPENAEAETLAGSAMDAAPRGPVDNIATPAQPIVSEDAVKAEDEQGSSNGSGPDTEPVQEKIPPKFNDGQSG